VVDDCLVVLLVDTVCEESVRVHTADYILCEYKVNLP